MTRTTGRPRTSRKLAPYLFVLPNMAVFAVFTIWPAVNGFNLSFYDSGDGLTFRSVGPSNYSTILSDGDFWTVARHTLLFTVGFVVASSVPAIALALLLHAQRRGRGALSAAYLLPLMISPVVVGIVWKAALDRQTGLVNEVFSAVGLGRPGWLVSPDLAMVTIVLVGVWIHLGFYALILLSGLQAIDTTVYEAAASTDAASGSASGGSPCRCCAPPSRWSSSSPPSRASRPSTTSSPSAAAARSVPPP
ncbi:carbohydrate ABC transporter permease [Streptomyces sp. NPDC004270]